MASRMRRCVPALLFASAAHAVVRTQPDADPSASCDDAMEESVYLQSRRTLASSSAGSPSEIVAADLLGIHDLLMLGYFGVMTIGPQLRVQAEDLLRTCNTMNLKETRKFECAYLEEGYNFSMPESEYKGLAQARSAAIDLARLLPDVHPVPSCRDAFNRNMRECDAQSDCSDENLVEIQAAEAWACINISQEMVLPTCKGRDFCSTSDEAHDQGQPFVLTKFRYPNGSLYQSWDIMPYRNFVLQGGPPLGACKQDEWNGGGQEPEGNTRWLRACSFWASFHTMGLRADALGGDKPDRLFGAIARIISSGALWCGGCVAHFKLFLAALLPRVAPDLHYDFFWQCNQQQCGEANKHQLLMAQCGMFQSWGVGIYPAWAETGYMKHACDLVETTDLLKFQKMTNLLPTYGDASSGYALPNITATGVPLSTILAAHHNLVTYGVGFEWVRPKSPPGIPDRKRYYSPETAVQLLAGSSLFTSDELVQEWYSQNKGKLEPAILADMPGMHKWVELAMACFSTKTSLDWCDDKYNKDWFDMWQKTHPERGEENA